MTGESDASLFNQDWHCRNCGFRFIPTFWISAGLNDLVAQCPKCGSNATEPIIEYQAITFHWPSKTYTSNILDNGTYYSPFVPCNLPFGFWDNEIDKIWDTV